jgi:hypothetical protein
MRTHMARIWFAVFALAGLDACDSAHWSHAECEKQADDHLRAVTALERRQECNGPRQCADVDRERAAVNATRREADVFACMQSRGFTFDVDGWARDQHEKRARPPHVYWKGPLSGG